MQNWETYVDKCTGNMVETLIIVYVASAFIEKKNYEHHCKNTFLLNNI